MLWNIAAILLFLGGSGAIIIGLDSLWESQGRRRLMTMVKDLGPPGVSPDVVVWGNNCVLMAYTQQEIVVAAHAEKAWETPVSAIIDLVMVSDLTGAATSRLEITMSDPINPQVSLTFPGDRARSAHAAVNSMLSGIRGSTVETVQAEEVMEEEEKEETGQPATIVSTADDIAAMLIPPANVIGSARRGTGRGGVVIAEFHKDGRQG